MIADSDKRYLKDHIIDCITHHRQNKMVADTYAIILEKLVTFDFPDRWSNLPSLTLSKLMACNKVEELYGSLTAVNILIKTITLVAHNSKNATEEFVSKIFPNLEILLNNQMSQWNEHSAEILFQVFKSFLNVVTIELPEYLDTRKNANSFNLWMNAIQAVIDRPLREDLTSGLRSWKDQLEREKHVEWKLKRVAVQILNWYRKLT
jgi:hypothetical protein